MTSEEERISLALQEKQVGSVAFGTPQEQSSGRICEQTSGPQQRAYPAEKARQGEIILRAHWQRIVFVGALAACVILVIILRIVAGR